MLPLAREFQSFFIFGTLILIGMQIFVGAAVSGLWIAWCAFAFFIRDFRRQVPPVPLANISPIDGVVSLISSRQDPFLQRPARCHTILQSGWGEFNLHSPVEGKVEQLWLREAGADKKALAFWLRTDEGDDVTVHVELHSFLQHASAGLHPGERVGQGQRCGFVAWGCKVYVYFPQNVQNACHEGESVIAGKSILTRFVR